MHHPRPDEIIGAKQLKGARHLSRVEITAFGHGVFEEANFRIIDEEHEFASFGKIRLRREQSYGLKPFVAAPPAFSAMLRRERPAAFDSPRSERPRATRSEDRRSVFSSRLRIYGRARPEARWRLA